MAPSVNEVAHSDNEAADMETSEFDKSTTSKCAYSFANCVASQPLAGPASLLEDQISVMLKQESTIYAYSLFSRAREAYSGDSSENDIRKNEWRDKIVQWTYSVVDHFDLSRDTAAISMSLFDRYLATKENQCNGNAVLLLSLTTLSIAVKINETKSISVQKLSDLSRGQFNPSDIQKCELIVLQTLNWRVNAPTPVAFLSHMLQILRPRLEEKTRRQVFELARYATELSMCDSYFVGTDSSVLAYACLLYVFDVFDEMRCSLPEKASFVQHLSILMGQVQLAPDVVNAKQIIESMFSDPIKQYAKEEMVSDTRIGGGGEMEARQEIEACVHRTHHVRSPSFGNGTAKKSGVHTNALRLASVSRAQ